MGSVNTGMFITALGNGGTQTDKVKRYDSYQEMIDDNQGGPLTV